MSCSSECTGGRCCEEPDGDLQAGGRGLSPAEIAALYLVVPRGPSVIIVGPDGVGKTTIAAQLNKITGIPTFKCPSEKQIFKQGGASSLAFDYTMTHFLSQTGFRFISDRGYPCEWTYSRVFGRETDRQMLGLIDAAHANIGTRILYLYSSVQPIEPDDIVPADKYWDVKRTYDDFCEWTSCRVTAFDTNKMIRAFQDGGDVSAATAETLLKLLNMNERQPK